MRVTLDPSYLLLLLSLSLVFCKQAPIITQLSPPSSLPTAASTLMGATSIPSVVWPAPLAPESFPPVSHYQAQALRPHGYTGIPSSTGPVTMTSTEVC